MEGRPQLLVSAPYQRCIAPLLVQRDESAVVDSQHTESDHHNMTYVEMQEVILVWDMWMGDSQGSGAEEAMLEKRVTQVGALVDGKDDPY